MEKTQNLDVKIVYISVKLCSNFKLINANFQPIIKIQFTFVLSYSRGKHSRLFTLVLFRHLSLKGIRSTPIRVINLPFTGSSLLPNLPLCLIYTLAYSLMSGVNQCFLTGYVVLSTEINFSMLPDIISLQFNSTNSCNFTTKA